MQKLKKKARINIEDPILIFYQFGEKAQHLREAVSKEAKMIENAVKKPFLHFRDHCGYLDLAVDSGLIDEEEYSLKVCTPGPLFNIPALEVVIRSPRNPSERQQR